MGSSQEERQKYYRALFDSHVEGRLLEDIRKASNKGLVLGNDRFVEELEQLSNRWLKEGSRDSPKKNVI